AAEDALCASGVAEPDPPLAPRPWCRLLQRAAVPRLEAHLRCMAEDAPGRPFGDLEVVRPPLPAGARPLPLVRLGRFRPPHIGAVPRRRQRALRDTAELERPGKASGGRSLITRGRRPGRAFVCWEMSKWGKA